jgi:hypothetical protein
MHLFQHSYHNFQVSICYLCLEAKNLIYEIVSSFGKLLRLLTPSDVCKIAHRDSFPR